MKSKTARAIRQFLAPILFLTLAAAVDVGCGTLVRPLSPQPSGATNLVYGVDPGVSNALYLAGEAVKVAPTGPWTPIAVSLLGAASLALGAYATHKNSVIANAAVNASAQPPLPPKA